MDGMGEFLRFYTERFDNINRLEPTLQRLVASALEAVSFRLDTINGTLANLNLPGADVLARIESRLGAFSMAFDELKSQLQTNNETLSKALSEISTKIQAGNADVQAKIDQAVAAQKQQDQAGFDARIAELQALVDGQTDTAKQLDDIVPDATTEPAPTPAEPTPTEPSPAELTPEPSAPAE